MDISLSFPQIKPTMKRLQVAILFSFLSIITFSSKGNSKEHQLSVKLIDLETKKPISGIFVTFSTSDNDDETVLTDPNGMARFTWSGKLKSLTCRVIDKNNGYRAAYHYFDKKELKESNLELLFEMTKMPNYAELFAEFYKRDALVRQANSASGGDTTIYEFMEKECTSSVDADFEGGSSAMQMYINQNVNYPQEAIEMNLQGRVYASFVIEKDGTISHVRIERGVCDVLDYQTARVIYNMPKWQAGSCDGNPIRMRARLPIMFTLN